MFIYLKKSADAAGYRYLIKKVELPGGFYFEISFPKTPSARLVKSAVKRCSGKHTIPIASSGITLPQKLEFLQISGAGYNRILNINAFARVSKGNKKALVIDKNGILSDIISPVLSRVGELYVVTENALRYESVAKNNLCLVGSSAVILNSIPSDYFPTVFCADECGSINCGMRFGAGGINICGDKVTSNGKTFDRALMTALYCCANDRRATNCMPVFLTDGKQNFSLDTLCRITV